MTLSTRVSKLEATSKAVAPRRVHICVRPWETEAEATAKWMATNPGVDLTQCDVTLIRRVIVSPPTAA